MIVAIKLRGYIKNRFLEHYKKKRDVLAHAPREAEKLNASSLIIKIYVLVARHLSFCIVQNDNGPK